MNNFLRLMLMSILPAGTFLKLDLANQVDGLTDSLAVISHGHHELHEGHVWKMWANDVDLDTDDELTIAFKTPTGAAHFHFIPYAYHSGNATFDILEGPELTVDTGSSFTVINRNRPLKTNGSGLLSIETVPVINTVTINPTFESDEGTVLHAETTGGGRKQSGGNRDVDEIIYDSDTIYAFRITALADNLVAHLGITGYKHEQTSNVYRR